MIKNIKVLLVVLVLAVLMTLSDSSESVTISSKQFMSGNSSTPVCYITVPSKIKIFSVARGYVTCKDTSGELKDSKIEPRDIRASKILFNRVKILKVYDVNVVNDSTYEWAFDIKANLLGQVNLSLDSCSVANAYGNCNWSSVNSYLKVTLK